MITLYMAPGYSGIIGVTLQKDYNYNKIVLKDQFEVILASLDTYII